MLFEWWHRNFLDLNGHDQFLFLLKLILFSIGVGFICSWVDEHWDGRL